MGRLTVMAENRAVSCVSPQPSRPQSMIVSVASKCSVQSRSNNIGGSRLRRAVKLKIECSEKQFTRAACSVMRPIGYDVPAKAAHAAAGPQGWVSPATINSRRPMPHFGTQTLPSGSRQPKIAPSACGHNSLASTASQRYPDLTLGIVFPVQLPGRYCGLSPRSLVLSLGVLRLERRRDKHTTHANSSPKSSHFSFANAVVVRMNRQDQARNA
jgi:hypothetical protein